MSVFAQQSLSDNQTGHLFHIDAAGKLRSSAPKRRFGQVLDSISSYRWDNTSGNVGSGTTTAANGYTTLATGATANSSTQLISKSVARVQYGHTNYARFSIRFPDTGQTNNVREFGVYIDANNAFGFRLSGTTFSIFAKVGGSTTTVNSGSFNGDGTKSGLSYTIDTTQFVAFEIEYFVQTAQFGYWNSSGEYTVLHTLSAGTTTLSSGTKDGKLYVKNTNSGGSTTAVNLHVAGAALLTNSESISNPLYLNLTTAGTTTLKSSAGRLQTVSLTAVGGGTSTLTLYDNTSGSGTTIASFDISNVNTIGNHIFGVSGVDFNTGLTAVMVVGSGTPSVTITWD